jgi:hypothetical protein
MDNTFEEYKNKFDKENLLINLVIEEGKLGMALVANSVLNRNN